MEGLAPAPNGAGAFAWGGEAVGARVLFGALVFVWCEGFAWSAGFVWNAGFGGSEHAEKGIWCFGMPGVGGVSMRKWRFAILTCSVMPEKACENGKTAI